MQVKNDLSMLGRELTQQSACMYDTKVCYRGFHKLDEIGNNANIGIRGFTTWKQKNPVAKCTPSEHWTQAPD